MWMLPWMVVLAVAQADVNVKLLDNSVQAGRLVELNTEQVVIEADGRQQTLLLEELTGLTPAGSAEVADAVPTVWIELRDGSSLAATDYTAAQGAAQASLMGGGKLEAKTTSVHSARFKRQNEEQAAEWQKIVKTDITGDLIVIRKNEQLDYLEGIVLDISAETVNFRLDGEVVPVRRERVEGVIYFNANRDQIPAPAGIVHDIAGSHFHANRLALTDEGLTITTASGMEVVRPLASIRQIDFSAGKIQYLSELEPRAIEWTPFFGSAANDSQLTALYLPRMNLPISKDTARGHDALLQLRATNADGVPEIHTYNKGIALHSRTLITWQLPDEFRSFKALAGIDARYRSLGNVDLVISGDGKELLRAEISGGDEPLPLDLDISGVRRLTVLVDFGKNLDVGDHLNLCNARVVK